MTVLKCKMCGGALELTPGETVAECPYCGTKQTVPLVDDDKKTVLYERANRLRASADFDRAFSVYEGITQSYPRDAEAFWGELLCKYGIEYVDDPATGKKIPTCHRSSFTSILEDEAFEMVMENCDPASMQVYRQEAKQIEAIRKGIIEISSKEPPSDVFICYKETDENGNRTIDSVIAQDVYNALVREGYRVFFSRISLEDKLGKEYEPYIFSALNSAKVMLVFGTKYEYFNAVWVKNEWNRYLHLISKGENKTLIPCYRDVDVYDMPKEFRKLQSQDMGKIGAIQDLVRGIGKLIRPGQVMNYNTNPLPSAKAEVNPLLKRAFIFLEDGNFKEADEYCEKVLDMDPENARAYLGKLLAEKQLRKPDELKNLAQPFDTNNNFQKILRYGNSELIASVKGYIDFINQRNETERLAGIYKGALSKMNSAKTEEEYKNAAKVFDTISGFNDSDGMAQECLNRAEAVKKDTIYSSALSHMKANTVDEYKKAIGIFKSIPEWKDAENKINECQIKIEEIHAKEEADRVRREHRKAVAKQNAKRTVSFVAPLIAVGIILAIIVVTVIKPKQRIDEAMRMIEAGNVEEGYAVLEEMGKQNLIIQNKFDRAIVLIENGDYEAASELLAEVSGNEKIASARYTKAMEYINNDNLIAGYCLLNGLDYKDSKEQLAAIEANTKDPIKAQFEKCAEELSSGNYKEANSTLSQLEEMQLGSEYIDAYIQLAETAAEADNSSIVRKILGITGTDHATENLNHYLALDEVGKMFIIDNESLSRAKELLDSLPDDYPDVREYKDLIDHYGDYIGIYHGNMGDDLQVFITEGRPGVEKIWSKEHGYFTYPNMFTDENVNGNIWTLISTTHVQRTDNQNRAADYADYRR